MIDWGNTPAGSPAALYLPQVSADEVLALAEQLYSTRRLHKLDTNTIGCTSGSVSYVPVPPGSGKGFAGLLTVDLPPTVRTGQRFKIVVRRITSQQDKFEEEQRRAVRYVTGAFQINIPVSTASRLLAPEENLLAVFKWKLGQLPVTNRWHPVLKQYVEEVSGRVAGFGGNPQAIPPSPAGFPVPGHKPGGGPEPGHTVESLGKVTGLIFDRFGDFTGFTLETEHGHHRRYHSTEDAIEDLVRRAWLDRYVVLVAADAAEREVPASIVLRRAPRDRD
jgi:hypothetical protein